MSVMFSYALYTDKIKYYMRARGINKIVYKEKYLKGGLIRE
jgi:hypothetical protein